MSTFINRDRVKNTQQPPSDQQPLLQWDPSGVPMPPEKKKRNKGAAIWMCGIGIFAFLLGMGIADDGSAVRDLEGSNAALARDIDELTTEVVELEEERDEANGAVEAAAQEQEEVQGELDARTIELDARTTELDTRTTDLDARQTALDTREAELDARVVDLDERAADIDERETAIEQAERTTTTSSGSSGSSNSGSSGSSTVYYANCSAARAAGAAPVYLGEPGYGTHLDRDRDGVGCE